MKEPLKLTFLISGIFFLVLWVTNIFLNKTTDYKFNFEFWTRLPSSYVLFSLFGLSSFGFLMLSTKKKELRLVYSITAVFTFVMLSFIFILDVGSERVTTYYLETTTVHVREFRYLFGGDDTFYVEDNFLLSHKVVVFQNNEDASTSYTFDGDVMTATETIAFSDSVQVYIIDFTE